MPLPCGIVLTSFRGDWRRLRPSQNRLARLDIKIAGDYRALGLEYKKDVLFEVVKRFVVALALCDDQVSAIESVPKAFGAIRQDRSRCIRAVVYYLYQICQADLDCVCERRVVDDGASLDDDGNLFHRKPFDQQPIEDQLAGVVGQIQDFVRLRDPLPP